MANESLNNGWHTGDERPDTWDDVSIVYHVIEQMDLYSPFKKKWTFECYSALCLWDWEDHIFVDIEGNEYYPDDGGDPNYRDHKLFWKVADLPPDMAKYWDKMYSTLSSQGVYPFYDEKEAAEYYEDSRERYEDLHCDDRYKERYYE